MRIKESAQTEPEAWEAEYDLFCCEHAHEQDADKQLADDPDYASWSDTLEGMHEH